LTLIPNHRGNIGSRLVAATDTPVG